MDGWMDGWMDGLIAKQHNCLESYNTVDKYCHLDDATPATAQRHQCTHHTPATAGEERET